ncbi:hypothetical protein S245_055085, partial [Arachis hypogaea]
LHERRDWHGWMSSSCIFNGMVKTVEERFKASVEDRREHLESLLRECTKEDA